MKKVFLFLVVFLTGCALTPSTYDATLYDHYVNLSVNVSHALSDCATPKITADLAKIRHESSVITLYTTYTSTDLHTDSYLINRDISEMANNYTNHTPSAAYCSLKLNIISGEIQTVLQGLGKKDKK